MRQAEKMTLLLWLSRFIFLQSQHVQLSQNELGKNCISDIKYNIVHLQVLSFVFFSLY